MKPLTRRLEQVLVRIALGTPTKEIAKELCISVKTAEFHRAKLMRVLKINNVAGLTRYALSNGYLAEPESKPCENCQQLLKALQDLISQETQKSTIRAVASKYCIGQRVRLVGKDRRPTTIQSISRDGKTCWLDEARSGFHSWNLLDIEICPEATHTGKA